MSEKDVTPRRRGLVPILEVAALLAFVATCIVTIFLMLDSRYKNPTPTVLPTTTPKRTVATEASLTGATMDGNRSAPMALIEYSDFQCPYCGVFARTVLPAVKARYVATGKMLLAFRQLPLEAVHPLALGAAKAADCAGAQGKFWPMHDLLFRDQQGLSAPDLKVLAVSIKLNEPTFDNCLMGAPGRVASDIATAKSLGVSSTPTFLVGVVEPDGTTVKILRRVTGAKPLADFQQVLDEVYASATPKK